MNTPTFDLDPVNIVPRRSRRHRPFRRIAGLPQMTLSELLSAAEEVVEEPSLGQVVALLTTPGVPEDGEFPTRRLPCPN